MQSITKLKIFIDFATNQEQRIIGLDLEGENWVEKVSPQEANFDHDVNNDFLSQNQGKTS